MFHYILDKIPLIMALTFKILQSKIVKSGIVIKPSTLDIYIVVVIKVLLMMSDHHGHEYKYKTG